ncbi:MAG: hypothetical protein K9L86_04995 [Candidatus Omnitrophica bacterium]|nr:hypothetical protein [Candidatus Omnitrophota bacterium]
MSPEGHFDFESVSDQEDRLDYDNLKPCPKCQKLIACDATICYFCGQDVSYQEKTSWVGWVVAFLVIVFVLSILFSVIS